MVIPRRMLSFARTAQTSFRTLATETHRWGTKIPAYAFTLVGPTPSALKIELPHSVPTEHHFPRKFRNAVQLLCSGRSITLENKETFWEISDLAMDEQAELHGFSWLSLLVAVGDTQQRLLARALVNQWIAQNTKISPTAWRTDVLGQRLAAWLSGYGFVAKTADLPFRQTFLKSLMRQYRYLRRSLALDAVSLLDLHAARGLIQATVALYGGDSPLLKKQLADFCRSLENQHDPGEGYPWEFMEALRLLWSIREAITRAHVTPPRSIDEAVGKLATHLQSLQHPDGSLSLLGGNFAPREESVRYFLSAASSVTAHPLSAKNPPEFFYLKTGANTLLLEKGSFTPTLKVPFSPLNVEFSHKKQRILLKMELAVSNGVFHGSTHHKSHITTSKVTPHAEIYKDEDGILFEGMVRWHLKGEPFGLRRRVFWNKKTGDFHGEDTFSSSLGFSSSLSFVFSDIGSFHLDRAQLICHVPEAQSWAVRFPENICAELRSGPRVLINGETLATKVLCLYHPQDEEISLLQWKLCFTPCV